MNSENLSERCASDSMIWKTITTGNFMGFDAWLNPKTNMRLRDGTDHVRLDLALDEIGLEPT